MKATALSSVEKRWKQKLWRINLVILFILIKNPIKYITYV